MKPLIERLQAERQDMLEKLVTVTNEQRHLRLSMASPATLERGEKLARDYACASNTVFRIQARLSELKVEIAVENSRLTQAAIDARAAAKKLAKTGSITETQP